MEIHIRGLTLWLFLFFCAHLVIGGFLARWYMNKISKIFYKKHGFNRHEATVGLAGGCMLILWELLLPWELIRDFEEWRE